MNTILNDLSIEITSASSSPKTIFAKQGDKNARRLTIALLNNGIAFVPESGSTAKFRALKPDGNSVYYDATINNDGTVSVALTDQALAVEGVTKADVSIIGTSGEILSSASFNINVQKAPIGDHLDSRTEVYLTLTTGENAISENYLATNSVSTVKIQNGAVTTAKIDDGAVTNVKIADDAVRTTKILNGSVTNAKIASVDGSKITNRTITGNKISQGEIDYTELKDNSVRENHIKDGQVTTAKIGTRAVTTVKIDDGAVTSAKIDTDAVKTGQIMNEAVTSEKLEPKIRDALKENAAFVNIDKQINFIAYSHTNNSGCTINTKEEYIYNCTHGYTSIKGDMRLTSDNKIIMCHDEGFTFDGNGKITTYDANNQTLIINMTYAECMSKTYASDDSHVCDFDTFIRICKTYGKTAFITLRQENTFVIDPDTGTSTEAYKVNIDKMLEILDKYHMRQNAIINSTNYTPLYTLRRKDNAIPMAFSYGQILTQDNKLRIDQIINTAQLRGNCIAIGGIMRSVEGRTVADTSIIDEKIVAIDDDVSHNLTVLEYAQLNGVRFYCYFVDDPEKAMELIDKGVLGFQMTGVVPGFLMGVGENENT